MIEYVTGDLLSADLPAIAHGCNCRGAMGSGIAAPIRERHPNMYSQYRKLCFERSFQLGDCFPWYEGGKFVFNLATQIEPGPNASLAGITASVMRMLNIARMLPAVGIPRIGAGIGGLNWTDVELALAVASRGSRVDLVVYTLRSEVEKFA